MRKPDKLQRTPTKEQRHAANPDHSVWVAASAGSGKTEVLVDRVIRLLLDGAAPDAILCLTFTKAAAAEMSNRLFRRLSEWIGLDDADLTKDLNCLGVSHVDIKTRSSARRLFARALETPGGLKIQTIHAFCERLLQLFPVESGMAPGFRVMEEQETQDLFRDALLQALSSEDATTKSAWAFLDDGSISNLETLEKLVKPFLSGSNGMRERLSNLNNLSETLGAIGKVVDVSEDKDIASLVFELCDINQISYRQAIAGLMPLEATAKHAAPKFLQKALDAKTEQDRSNALAELVLTGTGTPRASIIRNPAREKESALAEWLDAEQQRLLQVLEQLAKQQLLEANLTIYRAMAGVMARVNIEKRSRGLYDFDDLITRTAQLLKGHEAAQWVLYKLDKGLTHILVDEAQDTSPAQWTIINALAGEFFSGQGSLGIKRTVFAVGDLKQSIYSFQGADIAAFDVARRRFASTLDEAQDKLEVVDLSISYRSNQQILDTVDQVFAPGRKARAGFGPRADQERPHTAHFKNRIGVVELWDLILPDEKQPADNWRAPVDRRSNRHPRLKLAERIALTIKSWLGKRMISGQDKIVAAGDILILLQSRNDLFHALLGALRRHGVPVAGADRLKLQDSLIVQDLMMLGQVIRMPMDDHAVACVLKSPLVPQPLTEEELFALAYGREAESLASRLPPNSENAQWLQHQLSATTTPYQRFAEILRQNRKAILERLGQEADDAGQEFLTLALDYEQRHGTSLVGFLDWLSRGETQIKREMEADAGLVRLMTVHGAKGLQAPIVFLADAADPPPKNKDKILRVTKDGPERGLLLFEPQMIMTPPIVDTLKADAKVESLNERLRLLYVGMTRAADELYICGSLNKQDDEKVSAESWYPQIKQAIIENVELPGIRTCVADDGFTLTRFGAEPVYIESVGPSPTITKPMPPWVTTAVPLSPVKILPAVPSRNSDAFDKKAVEEGIAIHKLIEMMADCPLSSRLDEGRRWTKRLKLETELADRLHAILQNPELSIFFGDTAQSEVSIGGSAGLQGRIDRMAVEDGCVYLLDYKTNRNPPAQIGPGHRYTLQMASYANLLRQAFPGHDVKAALLWTQTGAMTWLDLTASDHYL